MSRCHLDIAAQHGVDCLFLDYGVISIESTVMLLQKDVVKGRVTRCSNHLLAVDMGVACRGVVVYVWLKKMAKDVGTAIH